jgi:hypothetical protein
MSMHCASACSSQSVLPARRHWHKAPQQTPQHVHSRPTQVKSWQGLRAERLSQTRGGSPAALHCCHISYASTCHAEHLRAGIAAATQLVLGIETSCDDTGVAVVTTDGHVLGEALTTQAEVHAQWGALSSCNCVSSMRLASSPAPGMQHVAI